jgi:hypothetical protein
LCWQAEPNPDAIVYILYADFTLVRLDQLSHNYQANTGTATFARSGSVLTLKAVEQWGLPPHVEFTSSQEVAL